MSFILVPNLLLRDSETDDSYLRIVAMPPGEDVVWTIPLVAHRALPFSTNATELLDRIQTGQVVPSVEEPPYARAPLDSQMSDAGRRITDQRYAKIRRLVEETPYSILDAGLRHRLLVETATTLKVSRDDLYIYLILWWRRGQLPNALAPNFYRCGAPGQLRVPGATKRGRPVIVAGTERGPGINVTAEIAAKLQTGKTFLKAGMSWAQAYDQNALMHFLSLTLVDGKRVPLPADRRPTLQQFKYWVSKVLSPTDIERATRGEAAYQRNKAERTGYSMEEGHGPGDIFQIDATIANILLRRRDNPDIPVGRPVLYIVTDQASAAIVGFAVALGNASWEVASLALECTFTNKVEYCRELGLEIGDHEWPFHHTPKQVTGDRGWDVLGKNAGTSGRGLDYTVCNLPSYRPDLKALVESRFELVDVKAIQWAPGATHDRKRGDPDDRPNNLDKHYDLDGFREFMVAAIIKYNTTHRVEHPPTWFPMSDTGTPTPLEIWSAGLRIRGRPRWFPRRLIRAHLLPEVEGHVSAEGLKVGRLYYAPVERAERAIFDRTQGRKWKNLRVKSDPRCVSSILVPKDDGEFTVWPLTPAYARFKGWSSEEVDVFFARKRAIDAQRETDRMTHELKYKKRVEKLNNETIAQAANMRETLGTKPRQGKIRNSADKEQKIIENNERRKEGSWTSVPGVVPPNVDHLQSESTDTDDSGQADVSPVSTRLSKVDLIKTVTTAHNNSQQRAIK